MITKCKGDNKDPYLAFLEYCTTPLPIGFTPSQLLMRRNLKSILPVTQHNLKSELPDTDKVRSEIQGQKDAQKRIMIKVLNNYRAFIQGLQLGFRNPVQSTGSLVFW